MFLYAVFHDRSYILWIYLSIYAMLDINSKSMVALVRLTLKGIWRDGKVSRAIQFKELKGNYL